MPTVRNSCDTIGRVRYFHTELIIIRKHLYTYSWEPNEVSLCALERRALFGESPSSLIQESTRLIDPSRSPFIKERLTVMTEGASFEEFLGNVHQLAAVDGFKVIYVQNPDREKTGFKEVRRIEKEVGLQLKGEAELVHPTILYGILETDGGWVLGEYARNEAIWLKHQSKPHSYSTSLNTRVARAVANIAAPDPEGVTLIDPCCGIGTVLVEALSMGMDIKGSDRNPLILDGVKENIAHFGLEGEVSLMDINDITDHYDAAIIDLPYNLCSVITDEEKLELLQSAKRIADKAVIVTLEEVDEAIRDAGLSIEDRCEVKKGRFVREVLVCS